MTIEYIKRTPTIKANKTNKVEINKVKKDDTDFLEKVDYATALFKYFEKQHVRPITQRIDRSNLKLRQDLLYKANNCNVIKWFKPLKK